MSESIAALDDVREYTVFTSDIDLTDADGGVTGGSPLGRHARWIRIIDAGSGTLAVVMTSCDGTTRTLTGCLNGDEICGKFLTIKLATDVAKLWVGW